MNIKPIHTKKDYANALKEVEILMEAKPNTQDGEKLEILSILIEDYEEKHFPISAPDPVEAINFAMEQNELSRKDLEKYIGSRARVSEIMNKKRKLTLQMIRNLYNGLKIPTDVLIGV